MIILEEAFFGIGEENDVDIRMFIEQQNYKLEKKLQLTNHFGDPYPFQCKHIRVKYRIEEDGCHQFEEFCNVVNGNKRIGYNQKEKKYEFEIPNMYHYKVIHSVFDIQKIVILPQDQSIEPYPVEKEKWHLFVKEMEDGYVDVIDKLDFLEWIGTDPFPNKPKTIQVYYKRESQYWIQVHEMKGHLCKDMILTAELPLYRKVMLFHFFPIYHHPLMELHVMYLKKSLDIFDKVIISVANTMNSQNISNEERIRSMLQERRESKLEIIHTYNCRRRGEAVSFLNLMNKVQRNFDYIFYAHSKGFTHNEPSKIQTIACWIELMYIGCLSNVDVVIHKNPNFAGNFLKHGMINGNHHPRWHYSGSYYWINSSILEKRNVLARYTSDYYIAERFPGLMCPRMDSCLTFIKFTNLNHSNLYDIKCVHTFQYEIKFYCSYSSI